MHAKVLYCPASTLDKKKMSIYSNADIVFINLMQDFGCQLLQEISYTKDKLPEHSVTLRLNHLLRWTSFYGAGIARLL